MTMTIGPKHPFKVLLAAGLAALTLALYACGGGSSSGSAGGSSGSVIAGTVTDGTASIWTSPDETRGLAFVMVDVLISTARADGIPGLTVELLDSGGNVVGSQTTDSDGDFRFSGLIAGDYSIRIRDAGGAALGQSPTISINGNATTEIEIASNGVVLQIESAEGTIGGSADDDSNSIDDDSDDIGSTDDGSEDDGSEDDDIGSTDDDSDDDAVDT